MRKTLPKKDTLAAHLAAGMTPDHIAETYGCRTDSTRRKLRQLGLIGPITKAQQIESEGPAPTDPLVRNEAAILAAHEVLWDRVKVKCSTDDVKAAIEAYLLAAPHVVGGEDKRAVALSKINDIRNSIIGCQTVNWSEHIYPLVAALEEAGIEGAGYPASRTNVGTMLERTLAAENEVMALRAALAKIGDGFVAAKDAEDRLGSSRAY